MRRWERCVASALRFLRFLVFQLVPPPCRSAVFPPPPLPAPTRPRLPTTTSVLRGAHFSGGQDEGTREEGGLWSVQERPGKTGGGAESERGVPEGKVGGRGWGWGGSRCGPLGWLYGCGARRYLLVFQPPDAADVDAAVRETEPSMGPQPHRARSRLPRERAVLILEWGSSAQRHDARSRRSVQHTL